MRIELACRHRRSGGAYSGAIRRVGSKWLGWSEERSDELKSIPDIISKRLYLYQITRAKDSIRPSPTASIPFHSSNLLDQISLCHRLRLRPLRNHLIHALEQPRSIIQPPLPRRCKLRRTWELGPRWTERIDRHFQANTCIIQRKRNAPAMIVHIPRIEVKRFSWPLFPRREAKIRHRRAAVLVNLPIFRPILTTFVQGIEQG